MIDFATNQSEVWTVIWYVCLTAGAQVAPVEAFVGVEFPLVFSCKKHLLAQWTR